MVGRLPPLVRHALPALVVILLVATSLASLPEARASGPNYVLVGLVTQPITGFGVPGGVTVQLISGATHAVYTTTTGSKGNFTFNAANTNGQLTPGWWGLWVPPQGQVKSSSCPVGGNVCAALPGNPGPQYYWEGAANLTSANSRTIGNVTVVSYTSTITGTVKLSGSAISGATVALIHPNFPGFWLASNTTNGTGWYTVAAPAGSWLLYAQASGSPSQFKYDNVTVPTGPGPVRVNVTIKNYYTFGSISSTTGGLVAAGFNQTLIDTTSGFAAFSQFSPIGYTYDIGTYPGGFTSGTENFQVVLAPVGYAPAFFTLAVSPGAPNGGGPTPRNVQVQPIAPPAVYNTSLNFSSGSSGNAFGLLKVHTTATLGNYSVFPELPNASVGQLWAQLALDWSHTLTLPNATYAAKIVPWIQSQGPFFPAGQAFATINGTGFGQPTNYTLQTSVTPGYSGSYGLASAAGLSLVWNQAYNVTGGLPGSGTGKTYSLAFNFRHPTNGQSINYTIILPTGYVLKASTPAPSGSKLVPAGPSGTWTKFYLVGLPASTSYGTANFTIVKYGNISAKADVSVPTFTFSTKNVLDSSRTNYTVVIGVGENATFSALNSTYPAGTNGSLFAWNFGDGNSSTTAQPTTHHIYSKAAKFTATLTVTSSGGTTNSVTFHVYTGNLPPVPRIESNASASQNKSAGGTNYTIVNWSTTLQFTATTSTSQLYSGAPVSGILAVAYWNISSHNFSKIYNFTSAQFGTPAIFSFQGAGDYLTNGTVGSTLVPFLGWQYNVTLTVWDGQGHSAKQTTIVLVRDTQKPVAAASALNAQGSPIPVSGVVEGSTGAVAVTLSAKNSTDPNNGSLVSYNWTVTNKANSSFNQSFNLRAPPPNFTAPASPHLVLPAATDPYRVSLWVTDRAGNRANTTIQVTVAFNQTTRPILTVTSLTGASAVNDGSSYTYWANVTNTGGKSSTAQSVQVTFYLTSPSGTGSRFGIAGSPASVEFFNVTSGIVSTAPIASGSTIHLAYNQTVRAQISWTPARQGTFWLWANATAANQYVSGPNLQHVTVQLNQNPTTLYLEYGAIGGGALVVILALIFLYRYRRRKAAAPKTGGRLERGARRDEDEDEEDEASS